MSRKWSSASTGFSLIELLVAVAIVTVLAALSYSGIQKGLVQARATKCLGNLKTWTSVLPLFVTDNGGVLPVTKYTVTPSGHTYSHTVYDDLMPYLNLSDHDQLQPYLCPVTGWGYGSNAYITSMPLAALPAPAHTIFLIDTYNGAHWVSYTQVQGSDTASLRQAVPRPHSGRLNASFLDGHCESVYLSGVPRSAFSKGTSLYTVNDDSRYVGDPNYDR